MIRAAGSVALALPDLLDATARGGARGIGFLRGGAPDWLPYADLARDARLRLGLLLDRHLGPVHSGAH